MDWHAWHEAYADPGSVFSRRLTVVQRHIADALDASPPGPLTAVSVCAGQGHDLIGALAAHPRRADVTARLVELDPRNTEAARAAADAAGLPGVRAVTGDAALTRLYEGAVPADLVLVCGVFGNISPADVERTIDHCTQLCKRGGTLIWTRHREEPDLVPRICRRLEDRGFARVWLSAPEELQGIGVHRATAPPEPLDAEARMFTFVGYHVLSAGRPPASA